jgi:hypothetical protein
MRSQTPHLPLMVRVIPTMSTAGSPAGTARTCGYVSDTLSRCPDCARVSMSRCHVRSFSDRSATKTRSSSTASTDRSVIRGRIYG